MNPFLERLYRAYKAAEKRSGFSFKCLETGGSRESVMDAEVEGESITVRIQGPMDGWFGVSAEEVIAELDKADAKNIVLLIESPGGFVSEGLSLYADLRARAKRGVTVSAESRGVVASAAVLPYLAADKRTMGDGAMLMVHNPWGAMFTIGDMDDIEKESSAILNGLRAHTTNYGEIVAARTSMDKAAALKAMAEETWYSADDAIAAGYAVEAEEEPLSAADRDVIARAQRDYAAAIMRQYKG